MRPPGFDPVVVAQVVARNIVPVAGIILFDWNALNVLLLYLVDTLLMMSVIMAGAMRCFIPVDEHSWASRANSEVGYLGASLFLFAFIAIPLGMPLIFMTGGDLAGIKASLADRSFLIGVAIQLAAAFWSWLELRQAIDAGHTLDELRLKRRFSLVFLRWMAVVIGADSPIGELLSFIGAFAFVIVYAGVSIFVDIAPDRFLRLMPGGAEDADPLPGKRLPAARRVATPQGQQSGKHRRGR
jgi:hypothetical protein